MMSVHCLYATVLVCGLASVSARVLPSSAPPEAVHFRTIIYSDYEDADDNSPDYHTQEANCIVTQHARSATSPWTWNCRFKGTQGASAGTITAPPSYVWLGDGKEMYSFEIGTDSKKSWHVGAPLYPWGSFFFNHSMQHGAAWGSANITFTSNTENKESGYECFPSNLNYDPKHCRSTDMAYLPESDSCGSPVCFGTITAHVCDAADPAEKQIFCRESGATF